MAKKRYDVNTLVEYIKPCCSHKKGDRHKMTERTAKHMVKKGIVKIIEEENGN